MNQTYLSYILHYLAQALLAPDILLLIAFIAYAAFCIGSVVVELVGERRNFRVAMPEFLAALSASNETGLVEVVAQSGLLNRQKTALLTVYDYRMLEGDALLALVRRLIAQEQSHYAKIYGRNNTAARVSPMLGLMGTLIPLGPGIAALGSGDINALSNSLIVAFDTTVAGLATAVVCLVIAKIRQNWYEDYLSALEGAMATMLQKLQDLQQQGGISTARPTDYALRYAQGVKRAGRRAAEQQQHTAAQMPAHAMGEVR